MKIVSSILILLFVGATVKNAVTAQSLSRLNRVESDFLNIVKDEDLAKPKIIAHTGFWKNGSARNSIGSLKAAQASGIYGSEFDVRITKDGVVVIRHDPTINGKVIESSTYSQIKDDTLSNGERIPTLKDYLLQGKKNSFTKLFLEIKPEGHRVNGVSNDERVTDSVVKMVTRLRMEDQVYYISFGIDICKRLRRLQPNADIFFLGPSSVDSVLTPEELHELKLNMDYYYFVILKHPDWVAQAHKLGLSVGVWTIGSEEQLKNMMGLGVDFITTDDPLLVRRFINEY